MKLDVNFNPNLLFTEEKEVPAALEQHLMSEHPPLYYSTTQCQVLIQRMRMFEKPFWHTFIKAEEDNLLLRLEFSPSVYKVLVYTIQNENEQIFLHQDIGIDIRENDYCYLGGGLKAKDLRVLVSKGSYQALVFPFSLEEDENGDHMQSAETHLFLNKFLFAMGIYNPESRK